MWASTKYNCTTAQSRKVFINMQFFRHIVITRYSNKYILKMRLHKLFIVNLLDLLFRMCNIVTTIEDKPYEHCINSQVMCDWICWMGPRHLSVGTPILAVTRRRRTWHKTQGRSRHLFMPEKKMRESSRTHHIIKFSEAAVTEKMWETTCSSRPRTTE